MLPLTDALRLISLAALVLLAVKLIRSHLFRTYRYFGTYVALEFFRTVLLAVIPYGTDLYGHAYFATLPISAILYVIVVLEVYTLVLNEHPGLMTLGRWLIFGGLGFAALFSAATLALDLAEPNPRFPQLQILLLVERSVMLTLFVFVVLIVVFLSYFPVTLRRNVVIHTGVFTAFFFSRTAALLIRTVTGENELEAINLLLRLVSLACLVSWIICLRRPEADVVVKSGRRLSADEEHRVLAHLDALNRTLMGSSRE